MEHHFYLNFHRRNHPSSSTHKSLTVFPSRILLYCPIPLERHGNRRLTHYQSLIIARPKFEHPLRPWQTDPKAHDLRIRLCSRLFRYCALYCTYDPSWTIIQGNLCRRWSVQQLRFTGSRSIDDLLHSSSEGN